MHGIITSPEAVFVLAGLLKFCGLEIFIVLDSSMAIEHNNWPIGYSYPMSCQYTGILIYQPQTTSPALITTADLGRPEMRERVFSVKQNNPV